MAELDETMSHAEWVEWLAFHALYDLPDDFLTTGQLGSLVSHVAGGKGGAEVFAPYFAQPPTAPPRSNLGAAFVFLKNHAGKKQRPREPR